MNASLRLRDLLADLADAGDAGDRVVHGMKLDSRAIAPGEAFVALRGRSEHGIRFAAPAIARGAIAVLAESPAPADAPVDGEVPTLWMEDLRAHLGALAARLHGDPSRELRVTGVTGTNGKTSIVQLLAHALETLGRRTATIGTLGAGLSGALEEGERTTPDVISVQKLLARFRDAGVGEVCMEVSSHALDQGRVDSVRFHTAVFTNLTRDHLDYHGTMAAYGAAKQRLFEVPGLTAAIVNLDDGFGRDLAAHLPAGVRRIGYAIESAEADVRASAIRLDPHGLNFQLHTPWGEGAVQSRLLGRFNVANLLAVAACLGASGFDFTAIRTALAGLQPVAGRMNRLGGERGAPLIVVDYAHTPDALEQALTSLRAHCAGALVCVFGCGGERDAGKRPQMARIAELLADRIIVTDDNPRGEDGDAIVADIVAGFAAPDAVAIARDRRRAIQVAVSEARAEDVVLVAGKGHERYQETAGVRHAFDDLAVAAQALEQRAC